MLNKPEQIHIILYPVTEGRYYEYTVTATMTFRQILELLQKKTGILAERNPDDTAVFERLSLQYCDPDVRLDRLRVADGMTFLVY